MIIVSVVSEETINEMIEQLGQPYRFDKYTYFYNGEVHRVQFETIELEIKFWHLLSLQAQSQSQNQLDLGHFD